MTYSRGRTNATKTNAYKKFNVYLVEKRSRIQEVEQIFFLSVYEFKIFYLTLALDFCFLTSKLTSGEVIELLAEE